MTRAIPVAVTVILIAAPVVAQDRGAFVEDTSPMVRPNDQPLPDFIVRQRHVGVDLPIRTFLARGLVDHVPTVRLNFFEDANFVAVFDHVETTFTGGYALSGALLGVEEGRSSVSLVVNDGHYSGTVECPKGVFRIRPAPGGSHVVQEIDPFKMPPPSEPIPRKNPRRP